MSRQNERSLRRFAFDNNGYKTKIFYRLELYYSSLYTKNYQCFVIKSLFYIIIFSWKNFYEGLVLIILIFATKKNKTKAPQIHLITLNNAHLSPRSNKANISSTESNKPCQGQVKIDTDSTSINDKCDKEQNIFMSKAKKFMNYNSNPHR